MSNEADPAARFRGRKYALVSRALWAWIALGAVWALSVLLGKATFDGVALGTYLGGGAGILGAFTFANAIQKNRMDGGAAG